MRAAPGGMEEMDARIRRVSSTHSEWGRCSRRSEISSSEEVEVWVRTTRFGGVVLSVACLALAAGFFLDFPAALLGATVDLGSVF